VAITTDYKRALLEDAYAKVEDGKSLRTVLRELEASERSNVAHGAIASIGANGRTTNFALPSSCGMTPNEACDAIRQLIDLVDRTRVFLANCAQYQADPLTAEVHGFTGTPLSAGYTAPTDADVFEWLIGSAAVEGSARNWQAHLVAIRESRGDYTFARGNAGWQYV
jgi:hypothetical protein